MKYGHIKLSRKQFDLRHADPYWTEARTFSRWEAWVYLLQLAQWRKRILATKYGAVSLDRGEFIAAVRPLAEAWGWSKDATQRALKSLRSDGRIVRRSTGRWGTVYAIVNYGTYQGSDVETATEVATQTATKVATQTATQTATRTSSKQDKQKDSVPPPVYDWLLREWAARFGPVAVPRFRAGCKPLLIAPLALRPGQIIRAMGVYRRECDEAREAKRPKIAKVEYFAEDIQHLVAEADLCAIQVMPLSAFGVTQEEANRQIAEHQASLATKDDRALADVLAGVAA